MELAMLFSMFSGIISIILFILVITWMVHLASKLSATARNTENCSDAVYKLLHSQLRDILAKWEPGAGPMTLEKAQAIILLSESLTPEQIASEVYGIQDPELGTFLINWSRNYISSIPTLTT